MTALEVQTSPQHVSTSLRQTAYPSPKSSESMVGRSISRCPGCVTLSQDLENAAYTAGNPVYSNGSGGLPNARVLKCSCWRDRHRLPKADASQTDVPQTKPSHSEPSPAQFQGTLLINNDRGNRQSGGRSLARRTIKINTHNKSLFRTVIRWDVIGFDVDLSGRKSNPRHVNHPRIFYADYIPMPAHLLNNKEKEEVGHVVQATCNKGSRRNYMFTKFCRFLIRAKLAYLDQVASGKYAGLRDDIANMIDKFESSNEIKFTALSDVPLSDLEGG